MNRFDRTLRELRNESVNAGEERLRALWSLPRSARSRKIARPLTFAVGSLGIVGFLLVTRTPAQAGVLQQMEKALDNAKRSHSRWYRVSDGGTITEQWSEGKKFYYTFGGLDHFPKNELAYDGKRLWSRSGFRKCVVVRTMSGMVGWVPVATMDELRQGIKNSRIKMASSVENEEVDGKSMIKFTTESVWTGKGFYCRTVYLIDPADKLPRQTLAYTRQKNGEWKLTSRGEIEYPADIDDTKFGIEPSSGEFLVDKDIEQKQLPIRWKSGLGTQKVGKQTLVVRDVVVDAQGVLGLVWTGGSSRPKGPLPEVWDANGQRISVEAFPKLPSPKPKQILKLIEGKPVRYAFLRTKGSVAAPLRISIPEGRSRAVFSVTDVRRTDSLYDFALSMNRKPIVVTHHPFLAQGR